MFLVTGITGQVGGAAARHLLERGLQVRALVRDPKKAAQWAEKGVELRQGDLTDATAIASALDGVEGAYLMLPPIMAPSPGFPEAKAVIASYQQALQQAPPPRVVLLSSVGSEKTSGLGLITSTHMMEQTLGVLPVPMAFVRAGSFFENYTAGLQAAAASGLFFSFLQPTDKAVPMIATEDIGRQVATLLAEGWSGQKIVELGSYVSPDEVASAMGEVLSRAVTAQAVPREQWAGAVESFGLQPGTTWAYEEMQEGLNSGWIDFGVDGTERVEGTTRATDVFAKAKGRA